MSVATQNINVHPHEHYQTHVVRRIFSAEQEDDPTVLIAYYDEDSRDYAESILVWFALRYGAGNVYNTGDMPPFVDSPEYYIRGKLRNSDLLIVIIGPLWDRILGNNSSDFMRISVRVAVEEGKPIIPICVKGAIPPREIDLPHDMRAMLNFPAISSEEEHFEDDLRRALAQITRSMDPDNTLETLEEFEDMYARFWDAYHNHKWTEALALLNQLRESDVARRAFKLQLDQYAFQIKSIMRREQAAPIYNQVVTLAKTSPKRAWDKLQLFMAEYPDYGDPQNVTGQLQACDPKCQRLLAIVSDPAQTSEQRRDAGRTLAELGDPRPGTGINEDGVPEISWVRVPAGEFIYHYDQTLELPTYYIARYPVTYDQFQAFIDADSYQDELWWRSLAKKEQHPAPQVWTFANHPRERVSWFDAMAFCYWLSDQLGYVVRLPTEAEWEKAARGTSGRIYPWGDEYKSGYANINETTSGIGGQNLREPTAVGLYPQGASKYGVMDMIGNVWEWCLNVETNPMQIEASSDHKRALRGGSWVSEWMYAHTVRRRVQRPDSRFPDFGFRIACDAIPLVERLD